jgi:broad specificity phosphatase PhoE
MTARLILISHASTEAVRSAAFPGDESLDDRGRTRAAALAGQLPSADECWTGPELRTRQTAQALQLNATVQPALRECDYGRWAGGTLAEIAAREPDAVAAWLRDPGAAPHGGETILDLIGRVASWLADEQAHDRRSIAVTHATVIRAAVVHVMRAPPPSFWRIDIGPLTVTRLSGTDGRWNVVSSGCDPSPAGAMRRLKHQ